MSSCLQLAKRAAASHTWRPDADTRDPKRVLHKIAHGGALWCLVEYASDGDGDDAPEFAWHSFASQEELRAYAARATGEPIVLPELSLTPFESERAVRLWKLTVRGTGGCASLRVVCRGRT